MNAPLLPHRLGQLTPVERTRKVEGWARSVRLFVLLVLVPLGIGCWLEGVL